MNDPGLKPGLLVENSLGVRGCLCRNEAVSNPTPQLIPTQVSNPATHTHESV